ncbi:endonuclease III [Legionella impletisoli]|uniref:Endonuclease III n=1 Tax=Legionella impletisoli TaxID=343510 RepID=A0A917NBY2_9GAMM|nr:endonuclease III [Legionella impletisoli]GGI86850.1 endonuclease III [Legionella impletisoli]
MNKEKRTAIFERFQEKNPHPTTELNFSTPFELLIAVILSAQATDISVNKATEKLFFVANTPKAILELGEERLKEYIKTIGLYNSKAKHILSTSELLLERYDGEVPEEREALEALPGVGRKTANVVLNTAFDKPTIPVDTHVFRVANRTGLAKGKTPLEVEKKLLNNTEKRFLHNVHHWLVLHGRYVCIARKPKCPECLINDLCEYKYKTQGS